MPTPLIKNLAKKSGKSLDEVEEIWANAKGIVSSDNPSLKVDSEKYWSLVTAITKKMLKIQDESFTISTGSANVTPGGQGNFEPRMGTKMTKRKKKKTFLEYIENYGK